MSYVQLKAEDSIIIGDGKKVKASMGFEYVTDKIQNILRFAILSCLKVLRNLPFQFRLTYTPTEIPLSVLFLLSNIAALWVKLYATRKETLRSC